MDVVDLGVVEYAEAWELQRSLARMSRPGHAPVLFSFEHPPTITLGRRSEPESRRADDVDVAIVEVVLGGQVDLRRAGQLVLRPDPRPRRGTARTCRGDPPRAGEALTRTLAAFRRGDDIDGLTGVWLTAAAERSRRWDPHPQVGDDPRYALNVDLDPALFTQWITACGLDGYAFTTTAKELGRR